MFTSGKQSENQATKSTTTNGSFFGGGDTVPFFQAKLTVNQPGDEHEREADAVADQVMRMPTFVPSEGKQGDAPIVQNMQITPGSGFKEPVQPVKQKKRKKKEGGYSAKKVLVKMQAVKPRLPLFLRYYLLVVACLWTEVRGSSWKTDSDRISRRCAYTPITERQRAQRRYKHGLIQVGGMWCLGVGSINLRARAGSGYLRMSWCIHCNNLTPSSDFLQRKPKVKNKADYEVLVNQGKWCRDTKESGSLHPIDQQCYREIPKSEGYPTGNQLCFYKKSGKLADKSPDFVSAVYGQNKEWNL